VSELATTEPRSAPSVSPTGPASAALWRYPAIQLLVLIGMAAAIFFFHLGSYGLWEPDEARYAEIAREMLASRNFIVPHLNYVPYIEKPPLLYWLEVAWMALLGVNEFAARLTPALAALVGVAATWVFARRTMGPARALLAGGILATSMLYAEMAQVLTTDMLLTATITVALFALFLHWREGGRWCWLAYVAIALGTLTKGPIAAIPVLAVGIFLWWEGDLRGALKRFHVIWGAALVLAIASPWFIAILIKLPSFFNFFFVGEYLRRFFQKSYSHHHAFYYYVPVVLGGLMPWTLIAPFIAWRKLGRTAAGRFCIISATVVLGLFSAASAKLIPYILPAIPPIAVLLADGILTRAHGAERADGDVDKPAVGSRPFVMTGVMIVLLGTGATVVAMLTPLFKNPYLARTQPTLYALGIIGIIGGALVGELFRRVRVEAGLAAMVLVTAVALCAGSYARLEAEPLRSYATLSREVAARAPNATLICYPRYVQGLPFYTHHRVILVGPKSELAFGAAHSAGASHYFFSSEADLLRLWKKPGPVVLVTDKRDLHRLRPYLGAYVVIGAELRKRAILKVTRKVTEPRYAS
jgi:4-amino-4-deoxy-L-arabinose transferase-like glycosyltransferase